MVHACQGRHGAIGCLIWRLRCVREGCDNQGRRAIGAIYFVFQWYRANMPVLRRAPTALSFRTVDWSCPLKCGRCTHMRANGTRCKNRVCFGSPVCWLHNSIKYGVKIKDSTIPGAGNVLFATRRLPKNSCMCPYSGDPTTMNCIHQRYPGAMTTAYTEQIPAPANLAFDCSCSRGVGSLANARFNADGNVSALTATIVCRCIVPSETAFRVYS